MTNKLHSREAEEAVIGAVLINPNVLYELSFLKPEHFFIQRIGWLWDACLSLDRRGTPIDLLTVMEEMRSRGQLDEAGGSPFLTALVNQVPTSLHAEHYGRIVEDRAVRRKSIAVANVIANFAADLKNDPQAIVAMSQEQTAALEMVGSGQSLIKVDALLADTYRDVQERSKDPKEVWGLATGLPKLDKETGGHQRGELTHLVGKPAAGKTWLGLSWAIEFGKQAPGAIFSLEMKSRTIGKRIMAGMSGVKTSALKSGFVKDHEWEKLAQAIEQVSKLPIWIDDGSYDTAKLRATIAWAQKEYGVKWFVLDYALLLADPGEELEKSAATSANLKRICHDLDVCGVILHSVTKVGMESGEPSMGDQRGSGQQIHDADVQLFITELHDDERVAGVEAEDRKRMATLWCSKGRELERSKFNIPLVRKGTSPFWAEYSPIQDTEFRGDYTDH